MKKGGIVFLMKDMTASALADKEKISSDSGNDYIRDFLSYIESVRALSENTVKSYSNDLGQWKRYMRDRDLDPVSFTKEDAALYAEYPCRDYALLLRRRFCRNGISGCGERGGRRTQRGP